MHMNDPELAWRSILLFETWVPSRTHGGRWNIFMSRLVQQFLVFRAEKKTDRQTYMQPNAAQNPFRDYCRLLAWVSMPVWCPDVVILYLFILPDYCNFIYSMLLGVNSYWGGMNVTNRNCTTPRRKLYKLNSLINQLSC